MSVLVSAADLLAADRSRTVLLDVRWALGDDRGRERYLEGHLPGAVFVDLPTDVRPAHLLGMAAAAGTGFTVSLFVAEVAFGPDDPLLPLVKISLLTASVISGVSGWAVLRLAPAAAPRPRDDPDAVPSGH